MGENSKIEWTDHTFNPWIGCEKVSDGCKNCYASTGTSARVSAARGLPLWGPGSARQITTNANWRKPHQWNREAEAAGRHALVFCASLADVFEDRPDLVEHRARLAHMIARTPWLNWLLVTKRPENAQRLWTQALGVSCVCSEIDPSDRPCIDCEAAWLPNIWLGTTCENQKAANERLPHLLATPAAVRFVSYEPALGPIRFTIPDDDHLYDTLGGRIYTSPRDEDGIEAPRVDWVIVGGESGHHARPFRLDWALSTIGQCKAAGVAAFVKQLGAKPLDSYGGPLEFKHPKAGDWDEWPEVLRVRAWPRSR